MDTQIALVDFDQNVTALEAEAIEKAAASNPSVQWRVEWRNLETITARRIGRRDVEFTARSATALAEKISKYKG